MFKFPVIFKMVAAGLGLIDFCPALFLLTRDSGVRV